MKVICVCSFNILLFFIVGCSDNQSKSASLPVQSKNNTDSILLIEKAKEDSILIRNLKFKQNVTVSDKTIKVIEKAKTVKKLNFELENTGYATYYRYKTAERDMTLLAIRIKLSSKSKHNSSGGNFFPNLNVFSIDEKNNSINRMGELEYQLYRKSDLNTSYLEQIFDYKESEIFVCWMEIPSPINKKVVICANTNKNTSFDENNVIGIINPKK